MQAGRQRGTHATRRAALMFDGQPAQGPGSMASCAFLPNYCAPSHRGVIAIKSEIMAQGMRRKMYHEIQPCNSLTLRVLRRLLKEEL